MLIVNWDLKIIFLSRSTGRQHSHVILHWSVCQDSWFHENQLTFFFFLNTVALKSLTDTSFESLPSPTLLFNSVGAGSGFTLFSS